MEWMKVMIQESYFNSWTAKLALLVVCVFFSSESILAQSAKVIVSKDGTGDYLTIQEGIDNAADGDTVYIMSGTYIENIVVNDRELVIMGDSLVNNHNVGFSTVVDGELNGGVFAITQGSIVLRNLKIQNGYAPRGGGIFAAQMDLFNAIYLHVIDNFADQGGGVLFEQIIDAKIYNTIIEYNTAVNGGGLLDVDTNTLKIINSIFNSNQVTGFDGGGINLNGTTKTILLHSTLSNNTIPGGRNGSGLQLNLGVLDSVFAINNIISDNLTNDIVDGWSVNISGGKSYFYNNFSNYNFNGFYQGDNNVFNENTPFQEATEWLIYEHSNQTMIGVKSIKIGERTVTSPNKDIFGAFRDETLIDAGAVQMSQVMVGEYILPDYLPTEGLVAWYPFNGNANDESGNGNDGENVDNSVRPYPRFSDDRNGITNSAYEFNDGGHLSLPEIDNNLGKLGTSTTFNLHFKSNMNGATNDGVLIHSTPQGGNNTIFGRIGILNNGIKIYQRNSNQNYEPYFDLNLDEDWHMLTYVINSNKQTASLYLDGNLLDGAYSYVDDNYYGEGRMWELGNVSWKTNHDFKGWIDDVAIWNRALTEKEIRNIYFEGNPPLPPSYIPTDGLVAWYPFNGNANDESGNGNNGTVNGAVLTTDKDDSENSAYSFDGVDDEIRITNSDDFNDLSELTISTWVNFSSLPNWQNNEGRSIITKLIPAEANIDLSFALYTEHDEDALRFDFKTNESSSNNRLTPFSNYLDENTWYNLIITYDGEYGRTYWDGELVSISSATSSQIRNTASQLNIGGAFSSKTKSFDGKIDDVAIWNRALTEEEIQTIYNQGAVEPPISAIHTFVPNQTVFSIDTTFTSVYLEDVPAEGFNAFQYTLNYDPDSLNVELLDNMGTLSEGFDLGINTVNPGQIIVAGSRVDPVTENGKLSNLKISYNTGGISHITLDDVMFNEGVPAATTGDARIESTLLVCGDVTGDNGVSALDASHILRHTVRLAPQYPLEGRDFIAGDVTSNGAVTAYDAYFVLREIVGLSAWLNCSSTVYNLKEVWAPKLDWSILTRGSRIVTPLYFTEDTPEIYALEVEVPNSMEVSVVGIPEDWNILEYTNEGTQYLSMYGLSPLTTAELVWNKVTNGMVEARVRINESEWQTIEQELEVDQVLPQEYILSQNYPNPFNPSTQIQYALPEATQVTLEVFNSVGQKVMELVNRQQSASYHTATFDASGLSSGVYLYKLTTPSFTETKKMLLIK